MWFGSLTQDYGVGRENSELRVKFLRERLLAAMACVGPDGAYVEKMKLIGRAANAVRKEKDIAFQP